MAPPASPRPLRHLPTAPIKRAICLGLITHLGSDSQFRRGAFPIFVTFAPTEAFSSGYYIVTLNLASGAAPANSMGLKCKAGHQTEEMLAPVAGSA
jgi:hypothetical protein